ncbi:MAG: hypothetical protein L6R36_007150 [Xanthoria steineri]|nr:MAG: hypothetical protein L6R36_007150 [Xanthoria steineri]
MAAQQAENDAENSVAGNASSVAGAASTAPAKRVVSTQWRGKNLEVTLPYPEHPVPQGDWWDPGDVSHYIHSTARSEHPTVPRTFQRVAEQELFKRRTDFANPYVRMKAPTSAEPRVTTMASSSGSLPVSKSRARTGRRSSNQNKSSRHSSLLDTDVGMEAWPMSESGSGSNDVKKEAEKKDETERDTTMGQLLDFAEENPDAAGSTGKGKQGEKKSRMQQLYELQGLDLDAVTTTTTTITTTTFVKAQPVSAHTSPGQSKETIQSDSPLTPQYTTSDSLSIKDLSLVEPHYDTEQPIAAATNNLLTTPPSASASNDHDPIPNTTSYTHKTPSSPSTIPPPPSSPPPEPALQTFRSQQLHHETNPPLGTELSTWAAGMDTAPPPFQNNEEASRDESGYVRRFTTRRGKASDAEPKEENAMVKWDPFGGLWGYAVNKKVWVVEKGEKDIGKKVEQKEEEKVEKQEDIKVEVEGGYKETKKEEEKETYFDALESFLNPT